MNETDIAAIHKTWWRPGWGSVTVEEAGFILDAVKAHRPARFVEIGTASGLSGALIRRMLAANGGAAFETHDVCPRFFGDPSRETGFLLHEIGGAETVALSVRIGRGAMHLAEGGRQFDMAFIDANHRHPWPLIDTLFVSEVLEGPRIAIHHDLLLHRLTARPWGIGPKYLFDQVPEAHRRAGGGGNIFAIDLSMTRAALGAVAVAALHLPWTLDRPLGAETREAIRDMMKRSLPGHLVRVFDRTAARFDEAAAPRGRGLLARLAGS